MKKEDGIVLRIEKTSIHDGHGLRTVVFLKGCPLKCWWCSTPESHCMAQEYGYGKNMSVQAVVKEVEKDEIFFFHSDGGITISGGEVLCQSDFATLILKECQKRGIDTAIETSFYSSYKEFEKLLPYLNAIFVDIKHMDEEKHMKYTGVSNQMILNNIRRLSQSAYRGKLHIRIPMIPGINMDSENMIQLADFCKKLKRLTDIELLPYHRLGMETYSKLNKEYKLKNTKIPTVDELTICAELIKKHAPQLIIKYLDREI